ncbi:MAG: sulfotransferase [Myxococcota bacterium]|nr:sulfotransferase [Myxococcota bacterium]
MSRISVCVIARDEEAMLPGMLASVESLADQLVVVDTGSTDRTVEIAEAAGAVVVREIWQNDFSIARNRALLEADGDWVLVLDCDERLVEGAAQTIREKTRVGGFDLGMIPLHNAASIEASAQDILSGRSRQGEPVLVPRLFRRTEDLRWSGAIHENVTQWIAAASRVVMTIEAPILHFGYSPELLTLRNKDARNLRLLQAQAHREPNNVAILTYLAQAYLRSNRPQDAIRVMENAWVKLQASRLEEGLRYAVVPLATLRAYVKLRTADVAGAHDTLDTAEAWGVMHPNLDVLKGVCFETDALKRMGEPRLSALSKAKECFQRALASSKEPGASEKMPGATSWASRTRLATVNLMLGELAEASANFQAALQEKPDHLEAQLGLAETVLFSGQPELALQLLEPHMNAGQSDAWVVAACASDILAEIDSMQHFTSTAIQFSDRGFLAPHRRIQMEALRCAASIYAGKPECGPGTLGVIGALMGKHPVDPAEVLVRAPNVDGVRSLVRNVVAAGQEGLLDALFSRRAESLIPGIGDMVRKEVEAVGGSVEDDGEPEFLFIGGAGRSGTTLLRAMLDAHANIDVGPERKIIRGVCELRDQWEGSRDILDAAGLTPEILDKATRAFITTLMESTGNGASRIGEKTPPNLLYMEVLGRLYPQAKFIHVIRDGRAVSASLLKQNWIDMNTGQRLPYCSEPKSAAQYWMTMVEDIRRQAETVPGRYLEIRYEDLVTHPREVMMRVLTFLEEPWDEAVLRHEQAGVDLPSTESSSVAVSQAVNTKAIDRWKTELSEEVLALIEQQAGATLKRLGYAA